MNMHYETMKVLLEYGADVQARSNEGGTALMAAAGMAGDLRMVQALLDKGADVHAKLRETNETAATFADKYGRTEISQLLHQLD
jgi:uncharacterized protein